MGRRKMGGCMPNLSFISTGNMGLWGDLVSWMDENPAERNMPVVLKDSLYHYFAFDGKQYNLVMTSGINLKEKKT